MTSYKQVQNEKDFEAVWVRFASSPEGRWALEEERRRRSASLFSSDSLEMARRVGHLEIVEYWLSFAEAKQREGET